MHSLLQMLCQHEIMGSFENKPYKCKALRFVDGLLAMLEYAHSRDCDKIDSAK
jgi:hypothetical protein